jgi:hypothetical protein
LIRTPELLTSTSARPALIGGGDDVADGGDRQFCPAHPHLPVKDAEVGKQAPVLLDHP